MVIEAPLASFATYREADGPWQPLVLTDGEAEMCVDREYVVTAVCDVPVAASLSVLQHRGTPDDATPIRLEPCFSKQLDQVTVTGMMAQPGSIALGSSVDTSSVANWLVDLRVKPGVYDLVATDFAVGTDGGARAAIRRGLDIGADTTFPTVDLDIDGIPTIDLPVTVGGVRADENLRTDVFLETATTSASISGRPGMTARIIPEVRLVATDKQFVSASASTSITSRSVGIDVRQAGLMIELPPRLDDVVFVESELGVQVSWAELPTRFDEFEWVGLDSANLEHLVFLTATSRWLEVTGANSLELDSSAPEFDPAWTLRAEDAVSSGFRLAGRKAGSGFESYRFSRAPFAVR